MARRTIELDTGNTLAYLGSIYNNPRDALKEYISNALDGWLDAADAAGPYCDVRLQFDPQAIRIASSGYPGMDQGDVTRVMQSVARSLKVSAKARQIGERGIGLFAFQQFATKATFWTKKDLNGATWRFELKKGEPDYEWQQAINRERLDEPGVTVELTGLTRNPLSSRSTLHPATVRDYLSEFYATDLRAGRLRLVIEWKRSSIPLQAPPITLEPVASWLHEHGSFAPPFGNVTGELYFDPSGAGQVAIRHKGLPIVRDMRAIDPLWDGFVNTVLCTGYLEGAFDVDFLTPLATRNQFEDNDAWRAFTEWLNDHVSIIADDVQDKLETVEIQRLVQVDEEAKQLADSALRSPMLRGLSLLGGARPTRPTKPKKPKKPDPPDPPPKPTHPREPREPRQGLAIRLVERPFSAHKRSLHSEYDDAGRIFINTLNTHYRRFVERGNEKTQVWYEALLIGKETVGHNYDHTNAALERLVAFSCEVNPNTKP